jgi:MFS transporter, DHA1 family, staphyloferrin B biosynthesis exporter
MRMSQPSQALRCLFFIQLLSMGAMEMSGPFWPLHLRTMAALSPQQLALASGAVYAGPMLTAMCFTPFWGRLADRHGHKPMLLRALFALAATQLWVACAGSVASLIAARLVQGALAGFIAASQAYGAVLVSADRRSHLMARLQVATALGSVGGPLAGGLLFDYIGFGTVNLVAAIVCTGCAFVALLVLPSMASQTSRQPPAGAESPASLAAWAGLLVAIALMQAGKMTPQVFFGIYAEKVLQVPGWISGLCYGATALGILVSAPYWGKRFEARAERQVLANAEGMTWICAMIIAVQALSSDLFVFLAMRILWGICLGALLPVFYALLSRRAERGQQGRALGMGNSAAKAGALAGFGIGSAALAWLPPAQLLWPVVVTYVVAAIGLRVLKNS